MFNRLIPGLVAATWLWAVTATAETATYVSQGVPLFNFTVPDGWEANQGIEVTTAQMPDNIPPAPRVVSILPPGEAEAMWTGLWAPRAPRLDPPRRPVIAPTRPARPSAGIHGGSRPSGGQSLGGGRGGGLR